MTEKEAFEVASKFTCEGTTLVYAGIPEWWRVCKGCSDCLEGLFVLR